MNNPNNTTFKVEQQDNYYSPAELATLASLDAGTWGAMAESTD